MWWRYAFKSVRKQLTSHHVNWADLKRAAGLRKAYIPAYLRCLQEGKVRRGAAPAARAPAHAPAARRRRAFPGGAPGALGVPGSC